MGRELETTIKENRSRLLSFIRRQISDAEEAEDLLQEVFLKASENFDALAPIHDLGAWLWRSVRNKIIDYYRSRDIRRRREITPMGPDSADNEFDLDRMLADQNVFGGGLSIEADYLRREITDALFESLEELPAEQRDVFLLQAVDGRTFAEIAELTGESINTLMARKRYAVKFLKERLTDIKEVLEEIQNERE